MSAAAGLHVQKDEVMNSAQYLYTLCAMRKLWMDLARKAATRVRRSPSYKQYAVRNARRVNRLIVAHLNDTESAYAERVARG